MDGESALQTISEVSITLAGLSGIAAAFRPHRISSWHPREQLTFWLVIADSLAALFFSVLPIALGFLQFTPSVTWGVSSAVLAFYICTAIFVCVARSRQLEAEGDRTPNPIVWAIVLPASAAVALILLLSSVDVLFPRGLGIYYVGLLSLIVVACLAFVMFLRSPLQDRGSV